MREYATQMEAAKKGILTPEMKAVAEKEYMDPEKLRQLVALGQNRHPRQHQPQVPESRRASAKGLRTKINVNLGISGDCQRLRARRWRRCTHGPGLWGRGHHGPVQLRQDPRPSAGS